MSTLGKVLLVLVFLASLGFLYVAARAVKTQHVFRTLANEYTAAIAQRDAEVEKLRGTKAISGSPAGLLQVIRQLEVLLSNQGRVWFDCGIAGRDNASLTVQVADPVGLGDKSIVYVFEQHPQPATYDDGIHSNNRPLAYLGEFKVSNVAGNQVKLEPTRRMMSGQMQAFTNSPGPFALYEQMPIDLHAVWQEVKNGRADKLPRFLDGAVVSAEVLKEFQRDGDPPIEGTDLDERILVELKFTKDYSALTPAEQGELRNLGFNIVNLRTPAGDDVKDAEGKVVSVDISKVIQKDAIAYFMRGLPDGRIGPGRRLVEMGIAQEQRRMYSRQLRDYALLFRQVLAELPTLENRIRDLVANITAKQDEKTKLDQDNMIQVAIYKLLQDEHAKLLGERDAVVEYQLELADRLDQVRKQIAKLEAENQRLAKLVRQAQIEEADRINREAREKVSKQGE